MAEKKNEARTFYLGTGRRKTSVARVRITEGKGQITINGRTLEDYFTEDKDRGAVTGPMQVTELANRLDVIVKVHGGGITGQAGAICQGLARAIKTMFSPADEQKRVTFRNTTMVRSRRVDPKSQPAGTPAAAPSADGAPPSDENVGLVKRLRDSGYLTRDSRMKERKKYGLRGARRGTQFSKR
jgi:small subunit ribosomal protein S9